MKWVFLCLTTFFLTCAAFAESVSFSQFGGLNTDDAPAVLPQNQTPDSQNVLTDIGPGIVPRDGFFGLSTTTCQGGIWPFIHSNGTRYVICHDTSENRLKASSNQGITFNITVSTVAANINTAVTALGDKLYFVNTSDGIKYWDTSSVTLVDKTLTFNQLVTHKGCLWGSGKTSAARSIYKSKFGDGTTWTVPTDATVADPAIFVIGGSVDEPLTFLYASFQDKLIWGKSNSFGGILGNNNSEFSVRVFSDKIGSAYPESFQDCKGFLRWLGSGRHVWEYDGANLKDLSQQPESKIKTLLDTVVQGDANSRAFTITSQADFSASTNYQISSVLSPADIVLSTWTDTDDTNADFLGGSTSNTSIIGTNVYLSTNNTTIDNPGFESGGGSDADNWSGENASIARSAAVARSGTFSLQVGPLGAYKLFIVDVDNNALTQTAYIGPASLAWTQRTLDLSSYVGRFIKIGLSRYANSTPTGGTVYSDPFICSGGTLSWYDYNRSGPIAHVDDFSGGKSSITSGTFTSRAFDTNLSSAAWLPSDATWVASGHSVTMQTQSSSNGSAWQTAAAWSTGTAPTSDFRRYIRYVATLSTGGVTTGTALPYFNSVALAARANLGISVSQSYSLGSISSFGFFEADYDIDGEAVAYTIFTDTDSTKTITNGVPAAASYTSSQTITSGSLVTLATAAYAFIGSTFTLATSTHDPVVHSLTVRWFEGATTEVPSLFFDNRYWLGVAISSSSNNYVLVFDRNRQWQKWSGINMAAAVIYSGNPLFSNSSGTFQAASGTTDDDASVAAYYKTPTLSPSGPYINTNFQNLRITSDDSADTIGTVFQVNNVNTNFSLGNYAMNTKSGLQSIKLPFPTTEIQKGRNIDFKFSVTGTTRWRVLGMVLDYIPDKVPE